MNVHWSSVTNGSLRALVVIFDLAAFVGIFLGVGFGASTRIYALTSHAKTCSSFTPFI